MSSSYSVFIGPAIKCEKPIIVKSENDYRKCSNPQCDNNKERYVRSNFCPLCGHKVTEFWLDEPIDYYRIMEECEIEDDLFMVLGWENHYTKKDVVMWVDNSSAEHGMHLDQHDEGKFTEIDGSYINGEILSFEKKFKKEIKQLQKYYKFVTVSFYVFGYYM